MAKLKGTVLVVDDEKNMCRILGKILSEEGLKYETANSGPEALKRLESPGIDAVLTDIKMPGMDGLELLRKIKTLQPDTSVIVMTAFASVETAVTAMKDGAYDYVIKPFNNQEIIRIVENALERKTLLERNRYLSEIVAEKFRLENLIGKSPKMLELYDLIRKVAPTDSNVLILGESGTGKELAAKALHGLSHRRDEKFVAINCGAFPKGLLESELFGYEKGAFTDAREAKAGLLEEADGGTLFLDEIADLPMDLQVKVLRVLELKEFRRLGGLKNITVDVRILAATNQDLEEKMEQKKFRDDLFFRLNVISLNMPPLRDKPEDIPILVEYFINKFNQKLNRNITGVSEQAMKLFLEYNWPGNVRELENYMERASVIRESGEITIEDLPPKIAKYSPGPTDWGNLADMKYQEAKEDFEKAYLYAVLKKNNGNVTHTAKACDMSRRHLQEKIKKYGIKRVE